MGMMTLGKDDVKEWVVDRMHEIEGVKIGMGSRICKDMHPSVQVRHRCRCTVPDQCGEEERIVLAVSRSGFIKSNYKL